MDATKPYSNINTITNQVIEAFTQIVSWGAQSLIPGIAIGTLIAGVILVKHFARSSS